MVGEKIHRQDAKYAKEIDGLVRRGRLGSTKKLRGQDREA
jgi:hypothetical protein